MINMASFDGSQENCSKKFLWIEFIENEKVTAAFDIMIEKYSQNQMSDIELVIEELKKKNPTLISIFRNQSHSFQRQSEMWPGRWSNIGNNSPIKELSELRFLFVNKHSVFEIDGESDEMSNNFSSEELTTCSAIRHNFLLVLLKTSFQIFR